MSGLFGDEAIAKVYATYRSASPVVIDQLCRRLAGELPGPILEAGCGTADHVSAITEKLHVQGVGFDVSRELLAEARKKHPDLGLVEGDVGRVFPFQDSVFTLCFCVNLIHFVPDRVSYYREALRVTRNGGYVVTVTDTEQDIQNRTLSRYFPATVPPELKRYPVPVEQSVIESMRRAGWAILASERTCRQYPLAEFAEKAKNRAFSILRDGLYITRGEYEKGISALEHDLTSGTEVYAEELYTYICGEKVGS
jgi:SAM-dependent methyltransferase